MSTTTHTDIELEAAGLQYLGTYESPDGTVDYHDEAAGHSFRVDMSDVRDLGRRILAETPDAYSLWCAETDAVAYPSDSLRFEGTLYPTEREAVTAAVRAWVTGGGVGSAEALEALDNRAGTVRDIWVDWSALANEHWSKIVDGIRADIVAEADELAS